MRCELSALNHENGVAGRENREKIPKSRENREKWRFLEVFENRKSGQNRQNRHLNTLMHT